MYIGRGTMETAPIAGFSQRVTLSAMPSLGNPSDAAALACLHVGTAVVEGRDVAGACAQFIFEASREAPAVGADPAIVVAAMTRGAVRGAVLAAPSTTHARQLAAAAVRGAVLGSAHVMTVDGEAVSLLSLITVAAVRGACVGAEEAGLESEPIEAAIIEEIEG